LSSTTLPPTILSTTTCIFSVRPTTTRQGKNEFVLIANSFLSCLVIVVCTEKMHVVVDSVVGGIVVKGSVLEGSVVEEGSVLGGGSVVEGSGVGGSVVRGSVLGEGNAVVGISVVSYRATLDPQTNP
jgi:hypothetical protein